MKKLFACLLVTAFITGLMFSGCKTDEGDEGQKTIIKLNESSHILLVGQTKYLSYEVTPSNTALTWKSSNNDVVSVMNGKATAHKKGTATITLTAAGGVSTACSIEVKEEIDFNEENLTHNSPKAAGVDYFGEELGVSNEDGSYTFNGTAGLWNGGGMFYIFPRPGGAMWDISDYDLVELHLSVTGGSVTVGLKKDGKNDDLEPYPSKSDPYYELTLTPGDTTLTFAILEAGTGVGFQRKEGGPATLTITKAVYIKQPEKVHTITFNGGEYEEMLPIRALKIMNGRKAGYSGSYSMPLFPKRDGFDFLGWYNQTDNQDFDINTAITKDLTLAAQWAAIGNRTVSFDTNGADSPASIADVTIANEATLNTQFPTAPTKTGYVFDGWWTDRCIEYKADTPVTANLNLTARWVKPYEAGEDYEVPLAGLTVFADVHDGTPLRGMWIPLDEALNQNFNIVNYHQFTVKIKLFDRMGEVVQPNYNVRVAFTDAYAEIGKVITIIEGDVKHGWWNIGSRNDDRTGWVGTDQPFTSAKFGSSSTPLNYTPSAIAIIQNGEGYQYMVLESLTFIAVP